MIGLLPLLQARLLARHIRGDLAQYPALVLCSCAGFSVFLLLVSRSER